MKKIENFQEIFAQEMSRKEFLQYLGIFILGAIGITAIINSFTKLSGYQADKNVSQSGAYGSRPYGG